MSERALDIQEMRESIGVYIEALSEGHRLHRKIRFLLDIRGLLIINKLEGDYVEFGVYRGEMTYAAATILAPRITRYIGLDTFAGLPEPRQDDAEVFVFEKQGFMASPRAIAEKMMAGYPTALIEGDFRDRAVRDQFEAEVSAISVLVLDCNWPSSVEAAMALAAPHLQCGSIVFFDDYFVGTRRTNFNERILRETGRRHGVRFVEFMTYPPCARAFIVEK